MDKDHFERRHAPSKSRSHTRIIRNTFNLVGRDRLEQLLPCSTHFRHSNEHMDRTAYVRRCTRRKVLAHERGGEWRNVCIRRGSVRIAIQWHLHARFIHTKHSTTTTPHGGSILITHHSSPLIHVIHHIRFRVQSSHSHECTHSIPNDTIHHED